MRIRNRLLTGLGPGGIACLAPHLEPVALRPRQVLYWRAARVEHLYFIEDGLVSALAPTGEREEVEVWLVGREGMVGLPALLGETTSFYRRVVQIGGTALRLSVGDFRHVVDGMPSVRQHFLRYAQAVLVQAAQNAACAARHSVEQRVARWLMQASDGLGRLAVPMTHALLARLIGVRRSSVTVVIGRLEEAGLLRQEWGCITLLDIARLRLVACGCYRLSRLAQEAILTECQDAAPEVEVGTI